MPREDDLRLEDILQATAKIADFLERDIDFGMFWDMNIFDWILISFIRQQSRESQNWQKC